MSLPADQIATVLALIQASRRALDAAEAALGDGVAAALLTAPKAPVVPTGGCPQCNAPAAKVQTAAGFGTKTGRVCTMCGWEGA